MWDEFKHYHHATHPFTKRDMLVEIIRVEMKTAMNEILVFLGDE
jgi:hypothetical protein